VTTGGVDGNCGWAGDIGSGDFGGLSAVAAVDAGFAGETAGGSTGAAAWMSPRNAVDGTEDVSATAGGDCFCATGGVGFSATSFGDEVRKTSK
jgi:hypothetical protein